MAQILEQNLGWQVAEAPSFWRILDSIRIICLPAQAQKMFFPPNQAQEIILNKQHFRVRSSQSFLLLLRTCFFILHIKLYIISF